MSIGLFDSGFGGLTVLSGLKKALPQYNYIYLADAARFPYGSKATDTVIRYASECAQFLVRQGIEALVIACNTASSAALKVIQSECAIPVIGTIEPSVDLALTQTKNGRIGVIGTRATVASSAYTIALKSKDSRLSVFEYACPLFAPLVEEGMCSGEIVEKLINLYLTELRTKDIDSLILGCTHYPLISECIGRFMGEDVRLIECSTAVALKVNQLKLKAQQSGSSDLFYVTDQVAKFNFLAKQFLEGQEVQSIKTDELC